MTFQYVKIIEKPSNKGVNSYDNQSSKTIF